MGALRATLFALLLALPLALPGPVRAADSPDQALARLLGERALRGAQIGLIVADLASGEVLLSREAERPMVPASNQKLLVAAAALLHWGPAHRFETRLVSERPPTPGGVLEQPLWVIGSGDPSLVSETLWKLAEELRLKGIRELRGGLAIDASYFDSEYTHRDWEPVSSRAYHARVSAFAANYSSVRVEVAGAPRDGEVALVAIAPNVSYFRIRSLAPTVRAPGRVEVDLQQLPDGSGETVVVTGAVAAGAAPKTVWRSVQLPERYAASLLRAQLEAQGLRVRGPTHFGRAPADAHEVLVYEGQPLGEIVRRLNKFSNNFIAEQLVKRLGAEANGAPGSWASGTRALRELLAAQGMLSEGTVIADGSGLSPRNRVSPATLLRVIQRTSAHFDAGPEFLASLPLGGLDGTLEDRMEENPVPLRGKTGHLRRVSSLSGLLAGAGGRRLVFSVIVNGGRGGREDIDLAVDGFMARIAQTRFPANATAQNVSGD